MGGRIVAMILGLLGFLGANAAWLLGAATLVSWFTPVEVWPLTLETPSRGRYLTFLGAAFAGGLASGAMLFAARRLGGLPNDDLC